MRCGASGKPVWAAIAVLAFARGAAADLEARILAPETDYPMSVGSKDNPSKSFVEIAVLENGSPVHGVAAAEFSVAIGTASATVVAALDLSDRYILEVIPPGQSAEGNYDLSAAVRGAIGSAAGSVHYSLNGRINVDAVLSLDRSGSMEGAGYLEPAKTAAKLFVDRMRPGDGIGVVSFDDAGQTHYPLTTVASGEGRTIAFSDGAESGATGWTGNPPWGATSSDAHSGTMSWTDSPAGNYANSANLSLVTPEFSLTGIQDPVLAFWTRHDLEEYPGAGDYGRVYATSDNGQSYTLLEQYTGFQTDWVQRVVDLRAFAGRPAVKIRFNLLSDNVENYDGWYIDDIEAGSPPGTIEIAKAAIDEVLSGGATSIGAGLYQAQREFTGSSARQGHYAWSDSPNGYYQDNGFISLTSPAMNFTGVGDPELRFWTSYILQDGYDFAQVWATADGGASFQKVHEWTGAETGWIEKRIDLRAYANRPSVKVVFSISTDATLVFDGVYIDDVTVVPRSNPSSAIFADDMENGAGNWTVQSPWGIVDTRGKGDPNHPWAVILLTDGYENTAPFAMDVLPQILQTKTRVFTIALGPDSDSVLLQNIATRTRGQFFYSPTADDLSHIYNSLASEVAGHQTLFSSASAIDQGQTRELTALVDASVSEAAFSINWSGPGSSLELTLRSPGGTLIGPTTPDPAIAYGSSSGGRSYQIQNPAAGNWTLIVRGQTIGGSPALSEPGPIPKVGEWISLPGGDTKPVRPPSAAVSKSNPLAPLAFSALATGRTLITINPQLFKTDLALGDPVKILVSLTDSGPIPGASVSVEVATPSAAFPFTLFDDGAHGDGLASDGVFANTLPAAFETGLHSFAFRGEGPASRPFTRLGRTSIHVREATSFDLVLRHLLGAANNPAGLDRTGDGAVDSADLLKALGDAPQGRSQ